MAPSPDPESRPPVSTDCREPEWEAPELVIGPRRGWIGIDWGEMYRGRELLYFLTQRDIKIRYKQTVLGVAWAVIQPLLMMLIFSVIFGRFAKIPSQDMPYPVFVFAGILPWTFFSTGLTQGGMSLVNQQQLLTKIYFPRLFVPTAAVGVAMVDMAIGFVLYAIIMLIYGVVPSWGIVFLPGLILLTIALTLACSYTLAALTVLYRDFRFAVPFLVQILMYASPVIYPVRMVPQRYQYLLVLNPLVGLIDGYRSAILGSPWNLKALSASVVMTVVLLAFGLYYFRRTERRFADIV